MTAKRFLFGVMKNVPKLDYGDVDKIVNILKLELNL